MPAKNSLTGITTETFTRYDREPGTGNNRIAGSKEAEARRTTKATGSGISVPAPTQSASSLLGKSAGSKVAGATRTKGGAI